LLKHLALQLLVLLNLLAEHQREVAVLFKDVNAQNISYLFLQLSGLGSEKRYTLAHFFELGLLLDAALLCRLAILLKPITS